MIDIHERVASVEPREAAFDLASSVALSSVGSICVAFPFGMAQVMARVGIFGGNPLLCGGCEPNIGKGYCSRDCGGRS